MSLAARSPGVSKHPRSGVQAIRYGCLTLMMLLPLTPALALNYYFALDTPATLNGTLFTASQFIASLNGSYGAVTTPSGDATQYKALHRRNDGTWLYTLARPSVSGKALVDPRDVLAFNGSAVSLYFDGSAAGIPDGAALDALFLLGSDPVVSFDAPVRLGAVDYSPSDLVRFTGLVPSLYWDAESAGVPERANLVGADRDPGGSLVVTFDVPVDLGGTRYSPGQLVAWSGAAFQSYYVDPAWPPTAQLRDFSLVPGAGTVPGEQSGDVPLTVTRSAGQITLSWGSTCNTGDTDYEVYEGALIGASGFYTHSQKLCSTAGTTSSTFAEPGSNTYWLVVARNALTEGSYGHRSNGAERPAGTAACLLQQIQTCP